MNENTLKTLLGMGATNWDEHGLDLLFLNNVGAKLIDFEFYTSQNGRIYSAELKGNYISHARAAAMRKALFHMHIDLNTNQISRSILSAEVAAAINALGDNEEPVTVAANAINKAALAKYADEILEARYYSSDTVADNIIGDNITGLWVSNGVLAYVTALSASISRKIPQSSAGNGSRIIGTTHTA